MKNDAFESLKIGSSTMFPRTMFFVATPVLAHTPWLLGIGL
jgi:hypothetical protein